MPENVNTDGVQKAPASVRRASRRKTSREIKFARLRGETLVRKRNPNGTYYTVPASSESASATPAPPSYTPPGNLSSRLDSAGATPSTTDLNLDPKTLDISNPTSRLDSKGVTPTTSSPNVSSRLDSKGVTPTTSSSNFSSRLDTKGTIPNTNSASTASTPPSSPSSAGSAPPAGSPSPSQTSTPRQTNFRAYSPINPLEDRYDFLTGRKVFNGIGDGPVGTGGGSGPRSAGGTVNIRGLGESGTSTATGTPSNTQIDDPNIVPPQTEVEPSGTESPTQGPDDGSRGNQDPTNLVQGPGETDAEFLERSRQISGDPNLQLDDVSGIFT